MKRTVCSLKQRKKSTTQTTCKMRRWPLHLRVGRCTRWSRSMCASATCFAVHNATAQSAGRTFITAASEPPKKRRLPELIPLGTVSFVPDVVTSDLHFFVTVPVPHPLTCAHDTPCPAMARPLQTEQVTPVLSTHPCLPSLIRTAWLQTPARLAEPTRAPSSLMVSYQPSSASSAPQLAALLAFTAAVSVVQPHSIQG